MPPKEGLQEQTPRLEREGVIRQVLALRRAAAALASVPAWPPPMMRTSYLEELSVVGWGLYGLMLSVTVAKAFLVRESSRGDDLTRGA